MIPRVSVYFSLVFIKNWTNLDAFYIYWTLTIILQDDAHIFCLDDQIKDEIRGVLDLTEEMLLKFGFDKYEVNLSTRPEKAVGGDDIWEKATSALKDALNDKGWSYQIDKGGGAFYGPKIDLKIEDALGRKWQCSTIQVFLTILLCSQGPWLEVKPSSPPFSVVFLHHLLFLVHATRVKINIRCQNPTILSLMNKL